MARQQGAAHAVVAETAEAVAGGTRPVAVFVCHGMGEQVPFESIDAVASIIDAFPLPKQPIKTSVHRNGNERMPRAEMQYTGTDGAARHVHVFEAYWAPLTAGKVSITEVFRFLLSSGMAGLDKTVTDFTRYLFGRPRAFPAPAAARFKHFLAFTLLLGALVSLGMMSVTAVAVGAARGLTQGASNWPSSYLLADLTCDFAAYGLMAGILGLMYVITWLAQRRHKEQWSTPHYQVWVWPVRIWLLLTLGATIFTGASVTIHLALHQNGQPFMVWSYYVPGFTAWLADSKNAAAAISTAAVWGAMLLLNNQARKLLVDYLGDVLAYIAPHTDNKFCETRQAIQKRALEAAQGIFAMRDPDGRFTYDRVVFVAHSLGSVIAYDTLNALLLDDALNVSDLNVVERTSHLITFGSPLDLTAFIYREQRHQLWVRESLAANMQPLILDDQYRRRLEWVNIWSGMDPISSPLDYYDIPAPGAPPPMKPVLNLEDSGCNIPLMAHTMYWQGQTLSAQLMRVL